MPLIIAIRSRRERMKIIISSVFIFFSTSFCYGQNNFLLNVKVNELPYNKIYLASIYGHHQHVIDSAAINQEGSFQFQFTEKYPAGMYRIILGQTPKAAFQNEAPQSILIIFQNENTTLSTSFNYPVDSMQVTVGTENKMYYEYLKKKKQYNQKLGLLEQMLRFYPSTDNFYSGVLKQYNVVQNELTKYAVNLIQKYPNAYFIKIINAEQYPFLDAALTDEMRFKELKNKFFNSSDFQDTMLLYSNVLSDKILAYINLYRSSQYTEPQQTDEFIQAANNLLTIAKTGHLKVYHYTLDYVIEGFNEIKQDAVLAYISDNYVVTNSCGIDDEKLKQILQKTADYKRTAIGATAPEIIFSSPISFGDGLGTRSKLSDIHSDYTLIVFWASWCPHCTGEVPKIKKVIEEFQKQHQDKSLTAVFVSIDKEEKPWKDYIENNKLSGFINLCELKGWNGEIGKSYNLNATPTLFLLDNNKKIIAKPINAEQLINNMNAITK
jgi:thiol-disulfide isomerase/thioredoxin